MRELIKNELKRDINQRELAGKIGFSQGTLQKILFTETKFTYDTRKKVADYFHVPVSQFYDQNESPPDAHPPPDSSPSPPASVAYDLLIKSLMDRLEEHKEIHKALNNRIGNLAKALQSATDHIEDIERRLRNTSQGQDLKLLERRSGTG